MAKPCSTPSAELVRSWLADGLLAQIPGPVPIIAGTTIMAGQVERCVAVHLRIIDASGLQGANARRHVVQMAPTLKREIEQALV